jgi:phage replication initiation protein
MENKVIYDALSITSKIHQVVDFIELLGLKDVTWKTVKGAHGYQDRLYFEAISIHFNGAEDMGIWLEMMGQGCRAFETYGNGNYELLFDEVFNNPGDMKITRLDVAYDDHDGFLDIDVMCQDTREQKYVSRFTEWQVIEGSKGNSILHGSMKSDVFIRIYDKARERGFNDGRHWIRAEMQLRRDRAMSFARYSGDIGKRYSGVLRNYLRYVQPSEEDENKWRWPEAEYWSAFLGDAAAISIYEKPGAEYNIFCLENYVFKQAGNAIDAYIDICGTDDFFEKLRTRGTAPNEKYEELKRQSKGGLYDA